MSLVLAGCSNSLIRISKIMLFVLFSAIILCGNSNSWPSGLRRCDRNRKMPALNSTGPSTWLRDPNLLRGSRWPSARNLTIAVINIGCVRFSSRQCVKVGRGADKKKSFVAIWRTNWFCVSLCLFSNYNFS